MSAILARELEQMELNLRGVQSFASHGRDQVAVGTAGRQLSMYQGGEVLWSRDLRSHDDRIRPTERMRGLAFSVDGRQLFVASGQSLLALDTSTGKETWRYVAPRMLCFMVASPLNVRVAPNGELVVAFDSGRWCRFSEDGTLLATVKDNDAPRFLEVLGPAEDPEIIGADGFHICHWNLASGKRLYHQAVRERIQAFSASADLVAVRTIHEIRLTTLRGVERTTIPAVIGSPLVRVSPDGSRVAASEGNRVGIYTQEGVQIDSIGHESDSRVIGLEWCEGGLLVGRLDGNWQKAAA